MERCQSSSHRKIGLWATCKACLPEVHLLMWAPGQEPLTKCFWCPEFSTWKESLVDRGLTSAKSFKIYLFAHYLFQELPTNLISYACLFWDAKDPLLLPSPEFTTNSCLTDSFHCLSRYSSHHRVECCVGFQLVNHLTTCIIFPPSLERRYFMLICCMISCC